MKKPLPVGLLVEGNATASTLLHLPGLADQIGPVKSNTLRVARRVSNALRAGVPVPAYEDFQSCRLVLIRVPDAGLERTANEIEASELILRQMCFAFCETWVSSDMFSRLRDAGACVTTLSVVPGSESLWFIAEGDLPAVRQSTRLLESAGAKVLSIRTGTKSLYFAAHLLATVLPLPLLSAAQQSLRQAGLSGRLLSSVLDQLAEKMLRNFKAGSRLRYSGALPTSSESIGNTYLDDVRARLPEVGHIIDQYLPALQRRQPESTLRHLSNSKQDAQTLSLEAQTP